MSNDKRRGNRETRKPKKARPPKPNASNPSVKGIGPSSPAKKN
ncbi:hypothetical protein FHR23_003061 [Stakelama sediminis]|uniref:Uncharacterized protein n=1 Tax=Stakelama sediminis TaxID=463200 RepID=A0A840Z1T8_9SPHN|nr:hypothetical protein [Stakelama sediminis]